MNSQSTASLYAWSQDLDFSRDVAPREKAPYAMLLGWLERFRLNQGIPAGREACARFWKEAVKAKPREAWQMEQWSMAIRWYLRWLENQHAVGGEVRSVEERVRMAVERAGARRGLARRTRETYGRHAGQFARWAGDAREVRRPEKARDYLSWLVSEKRVAFATQKQALNGLVFFFKEVCGMEEVDLGVRLRKTETRLPVVLDVKEVMAVLDRIDKRYALMARIQYGGGLRLKELVSLRVKDVDEVRGIITVRETKGDKHRTTMLPESLRDEVAERKQRLRELQEKDRAAGLPGVALPGAFGLKDKRAGEKWPWQWFFPGRKPSRDPESGIIRRHHVHVENYSKAVRRAVDEAMIDKRATTHALRHAFDSARPHRASPLRGTSRSLLSKTPTSLRRFCHAPSGGRHGSAEDPRAVRSFGCEDDGDLHPCGEGSGSDGCGESAGSPVAKSKISKSAEGLWADWTGRNVPCPARVRSREAAPNQSSFNNLQTKGVS